MHMYIKIVTQILTFIEIYGYTGTHIYSKYGYPFVNIGKLPLLKGGIEAMLWRVSTTVYNNRDDVGSKWHSVHNV